MTDQFYLTGGAALVGVYGLPRQIEIDFVQEMVPRVSEQKLHRGPYVFDSAEEIFANKICTLVGRSEVRDLWDVYHLIERGHDLFEGIEHANTKDGGEASFARWGI